MTSSISLAGRIGAGSLQRVVSVVDRGLRLQDVAVRNAAKAVAADRVAALVRADAAAVVAAQSAPQERELTLVGA
jgi:hypothetical protein